MSATPSTADPFTLELQHIRGLIEANQLPQAAQALNAAQKKAPKDARLPLLGMRMAERVGNLENATQAARRALALATILEPLLIVAMGVVVMLIVLAVLLPIIQLNTWVK